MFLLVTQITSLQKMYVFVAHDVLLNSIVVSLNTSKATKKSLVALTIFDKEKMANTFVLEWREDLHRYNINFGHVEVKHLCQIEN